jgi:elongation factor P--(R)-beta-lysine ligase
VRTLEKKRDEFLSKYWPKYPSAPESACDVAFFLTSSTSRGSTALVCGRLKKSKPQAESEFGDWTLSSGGLQLNFKFAPQISWLKPDATTTTSSFEESLLRSGDLICVELKAIDKENYEARALALLVPTRGDFQPRSSFTVERSRQWADFLQAVREFFTNGKFTEASTPTLVVSPGTEPYLDVFSTEWLLGSKRQTVYLPTSPEFHLKKMLVLGWTRIFEFKTCFRNGEIGDHHQPEFHMLEWYRAYNNLDAIADDVEKLFEFLLARFAPKKNSQSFSRTTMASLFAQHFGGFQLKPETSREELIQLAKKNQILVSDSDSWDDVFFRLFLEKIEATLGANGPLLVRDYPPKQAALARIGANGFADRFEVYWGGLELANAFHELNDPAENEARFREDHERKKELGKPAVPVDEELVRALYYGLPPSGGIALGLDRLFMAIFDIPTIAETRAFPERA